MTASRSFIVKSLAFLALAACAAAAPAQQKIAIAAQRVITGSGPDIEGGVLLVDHGKVAGVVALDAVPPEFTRVDRSRSTIAPGMIDLLSSAGLPLDLDEVATSTDQHARVIDALNLQHRDFALAARAGLTALAIMPGAGNVVSGAGCVVKTAGRAGRVLGSEQPLRLNLGREAIAADRFPTSFMGAHTALRDALEGARAADQASTPLGQLVRGLRSGIVWANDERELRAVFDLRKKLALDLAITGADQVRDLLDETDVRGARVALAALDLTDHKRDLTLPKALLDAGCRPAFFAGTPAKSADVLRIGAALAARHGLPRAAAVASITLVPAEIAGVASVTGSLATGKDADFIVLSGDLLDLSARLEETWISGARVARGAAQESR
jgi:imidazolonepropionase-like amidohydrolase